MLLTQYDDGINNITVVIIIIIIAFNRYNILCPARRWRRRGDWHLVHGSIDLNRFLEQRLFHVFLSVRFGHVQCFEEHSLAGRLLVRSKPQNESDYDVFYTEEQQKTSIKNWYTSFSWIL